MHCLTNLAGMAHYSAVAQTTRCGTENPELNGGHRHQSGFFTSVAWIPAFYGRAMREPFGVAGFRLAGFSARMVPPSLTENGAGGVKTLNGAFAMQTLTRGASAPAKSLIPFIVTLRLDGAVRRCLMLSGKSAEALQAVLNRQPEGVAFSASCHVVGGTA